ncbi:MAG TPA: UvrB/UvrC motif-containing protein [Gemmatimonadaceae bacterium]|nr:UvrB/UvrC motif-containing protein [Gemmatimonadaceae bacterium]
MSRRKRRRSASEEIEARVVLLKERVSLDVRDRPGVYHMVSPDGEIVYVGKAKKLRTRLLGYFRAAYPAEKSARIIRDAAEVKWEYLPSEFAALLRELQLIKQWRPRHNWAMKYDARHYAFVRIAPGPAPRFQVVRTAGNDAVGIYYGPFHGANQLGEALRELNDALGLRDCRHDMPMHFADQTELPVAAARTPGCIRYEVGKCLGPCVGGTTSAKYRAQFALARDFFSGVNETPIDAMRAAMEESSDRLEFERAASLRDKLLRLESLRDQFARLRFSVESLSFVYTVPGFNNDDRAYVIRRGRVRAVLPAARTAAEKRALAARAAEILGPREVEGAPVPAHEVDELMLVSSWFRRFPHELERTSHGAQVSDALTA